ncbi:MAG: hypothetical protein MUD12_11150 [Spirochaetes bacterium]|nr:hypothetical protein [Spirochaetota bacterium]
MPGARGNGNREKKNTHGLRAPGGICLAGPRISTIGAIACVTVKIDGNLQSAPLHFTIDTVPYRSGKLFSVSILSVACCIIVAG